MKKHDKTVRQVYNLSDIALLAGLGYTILLCWVMMLPFWHHGYRIAGQDGVFSQKESLVCILGCKTSV